MSRKKRRSPKVRVNFDMTRSEYETLQEIAAQTDTDVSKVFRSLARSFVKRWKGQSLAKSLVYEKGAEKLSEPEMPEVIEEAVGSENVA